MEVLQQSRLLKCLIIASLASLFWFFTIISNISPTQQTRIRNLLTTLNIFNQDDAQPQLQNISDCLCSRAWMYPPDYKSQHRKYLKRLNSSCSDEGTHYQANQNVISFSMFYAPNSKLVIKKSLPRSPITYQIGLLQNLLMTKKHYPGYSVRVYTSVPLQPRGYFCNLLCHNKELFWCDIRNTSSHGDLSRMNFRTWRFLPLGDPTVKIFHSRDLDSLVSDREAATVRDWLFNSSKAIMGMRDLKLWHDHALMAGMWGADNTKLGRKAESLRQQMISISQQPGSNKEDFFFDQRLLANLLFYPMASNVVTYDSYTCAKWSKFTEVRAFPVKRYISPMGPVVVGSRSGFLGNWTKRVENKLMGFECPVECRPLYGRDWVYC